MSLFHPVTELSDSGAEAEAPAVKARQPGSKLSTHSSRFVTIVFNNRLVIDFSGVERAGRRSLSLWLNQKQRSEGG